MPVITLCRLLFKHPPSFTNVKLGLSPIENCQRKRSYDGGLGVLVFGRRVLVCVRGRAEEDGEPSVGSSRVFHGNGCTTWRSG